MSVEMKVCISAGELKEWEGVKKKTKENRGK
jgi:hypothetical protein